MCHQPTHQHWGWLSHAAARHRRKSGRLTQESHEGKIDARKKGGRKQGLHAERKQASKQAKECTHQKTHMERTQMTCMNKWITPKDDQPPACKEQDIHQIDQILGDFFVYSEYASRDFRVFFGRIIKKECRWQQLLRSNYFKKDWLSSNHFQKRPCKWQSCLL